MAFAGGAVVVNEAVTDKPRVSGAGDNGNDEDDDIDSVQVPVNYVYRYVTGELEEVESFKGLIITSILVAAFIYLATSLQGNNDVFAVQESVWNDLIEDANFAFVGPMGNKDMKDVHSVADFWSWLRKGAVPLIISNDPVYSEDYALCPNGECIASAMERASVKASDGEFEIPSFGHYLRYNRIMGGVRLSQELSPEKPCRGGGGDREWLTKPCFAVEGKRGIDFSLPPDESNLPVNPTERTEWLLLTTSNDMLAEQLTDMEDGCRSITHEFKNRSECLCLSCPTTSSGRGPWIDESTLVAELKLIMFNPTYGVLTRVQLVFFFSHGGRIWKRLDMRSIRTELSETPPVGTIIAMVVWVLLTLHLIFGETREIIETIRAFGWTHAPGKYLKFWNAVDWISIAISAVIVVLLLRLISASSEASDIAWSMTSTVQTDVLNDAFEKLDSAFASSYAFRMALFVYAIVVVLRCFKAFSSQQRLAVVSKTLLACTTDVIHFSFVFMFIFTMFNVAGVIIFGHRVHSFATLERASFTGLFILMGDFDYDEMEMAAGRPLARFWLSMFFIVLVLLMFNMLLAIVFETYSEIRAGLGDTAETVWGQVYDFLDRDFRERKGERRTLNHIEHDLRKKYASKEKPSGQQAEEVEAEETLITVVEFQQMCPGMKLPQARVIFQHAYEQLKRDEDDKKTDPPDEGTPQAGKTPRAADSARVPPDSHPIPSPPRDEPKAQSPLSTQAADRSPAKPATGGLPEASGDMTDLRILSTEALADVLSRLDALSDAVSRLDRKIGGRDRSPQPTGPWWLGQCADKGSEAIPSAEMAMSEEAAGVSRI